MASDPKNIRNAFVVDPEGNVESREMPREIAPVVDSLEKIHNLLVNRKERRRNE